MNDLMQSLQKVGPMRLVAGFAAVAVAAALLFGLIGFNAQEDKTLLFTDLEVSEAGQIVQRLDQANIPYTLQGDGSTILAPRSRIAEIRLMLAADGLPSRGSVGYELFDTSDPLGQTQFQQDINRLRALEGELARTIIALDAVRSARVHLVLPERRLFERDSQQPSASILLKLTGGEIRAETVQAIRNLVAGAVPSLTPGRVTILDENGKLLAAEEDESAPGAVAGAIEERRKAIEDRIRGTVLDLVEGVVGAGNARVQVSADIDFNRVTEAKELFDPDGRVVRSTQASEEKTVGEQVGGPATAGSNVPDGDDFEESQSAETSEKTTETVNYEISRTTRTEVIEGGRMRKLSVAVAVDGVLQPGAGEGAPPEWTARDAAELERIAALVRSAVGFDEGRGDIVEVVNVRLARAEVAGSEASDPTGFDFSKLDPLRIGEIVAALIAALAVIFFVLRPLVMGGRGKDKQAGALPAPTPLQALSSSSSSSGVAQIADDSESMVDVAQITGMVKASSVRRVAEVVSAHPERSAAVLREWLGNGT